LKEIGEDVVGEGQSNIDGHEAREQYMKKGMAKF
jgi:hypothetical protein